MKINKFLFLSIILLTSCNNYEKVTHTVDYFVANGNLIEPLYTNVSIMMFDEKKLEKVQDEFDGIIKDVHKISDRKNNYFDRNNIKTINETKEKEIEVSADLYNMLKTGIELIDLTDGYFNFAIADLIDIYENKFAIPGLFQDDIAQEDVEKALDNVASYEEISNHFTFADNKYIIYLSDIEKGIKVSLGGICKGLACDKTSKLLKEKKESALISIGSSSIATINKNLLNDYWRVAIRLPLLYGSDYGFIVNLDEKGYYMSTSGDYEQNFLVGSKDHIEKVRHHILNPHTGYSENFHRSITLLSSNCSGMILDALSTALMNIEKNEDIQKMVTKIENYYNVNIDYAIIDNYDDSYELFNVYMNQGFKNKIDTNISDKIKNLIII